MGKGDKKTAKGKIRKGSFGNSRPRKKSSEILEKKPSLPISKGKKGATKKQTIKPKATSKPKVASKPKVVAKPKQKN